MPLTQGRSIFTATALSIVSDAASTEPVPRTQTVPTGWNQGHAGKTSPRRLPHFWCVCVALIKKNEAAILGRKSRAFERYQDARFASSAEAATRAGLAASRRAGRVGGRPKSLTDADLEEARGLLANPDFGVRQVAHRLGVSVATLYRYILAARAANAADN
jgi:hypothetical protein